MLAFLRRRGLLLLFVLIGLAFALYLTNIEAHVLEVYCLYCVISQGIIALITLLSMVRLDCAGEETASDCISSSFERAIAPLCGPNDLYPARYSRLGLPRP